MLAAGSRRYEEDRLQLELLLWLQVAHRDLYSVTVHYPAGGQRNKREAGRLKALGVRAGVPDLLCFAPRGEFHGLALELKTGKNRPSADQLKWAAHLTDCGWLWAWANSIEVARRVFAEYAAR